MLERPNHDAGHFKVVEAMGLEQAPETIEESPNNVELQQNFVKSIQELQMFFEQYNGTHSER